LAICFEAFLGLEALLSSASFVRMKKTWQKDYESLSKRSFQEYYLYIWTDGVCPKADLKLRHVA
jgi:hypothetical protein